MTRTLALIVLTALAIVPETPAAAAPPWLTGYSQYRIVDASGRVAPRLERAGVGRDRVALRPVPPPLLLRARPFYLSGYVGGNYGPGRGRTPIVSERGFYAGGMTKACGHAGACVHGR